MSPYSEYAIRLRAWSDIQDHMVYLHHTVIMDLATSVIELGVRKGNSTAALLSAVVATDGLLWSCDIDPPDVPEDWLACPNWRFYRGDSVSEDILEWMPKSAQVVFIDTSHTYNQTMAELRAYVPRVSGGGVVLCHDTQWLPPATSTPHPDGPVTDALSDFCRETGLKWTNRRSKPGFYGLGVIRVP